MSNQHYHPPIIDTAETTKSLWSSAKTANAIAVAGIGSLSLQGDYNATTNTPDLVTPVGGTVFKGYFWVVTVAGTFFGEVLEIGDSLISKIDDPSALSDWIRVEKNKDTETLAETLLAGNISSGTNIQMTGLDKIEFSDALNFLHKTAGSMLLQTTKGLQINGPDTEFGVGNAGGMQISDLAGNRILYIDPINGNIRIKQTAAITNQLLLDQTTASKIWTMPDVAGTVALTSDIIGQALSTVLAAGNTSGANDILLDSTQKLQLGANVNQHLTNVGLTDVNLSSEDSVKFSIVNSLNNTYGYVLNDYLGIRSDIASMILDLANGKLISSADNIIYNFLELVGTTAGRTWTMPDKTGTVALISDITIPTLAEVITEGNATGSLMKVTDSEKIQFGNSIYNFIGNLDGSSVYISTVSLLRLVFQTSLNSDCWDFRIDTLLGDSSLFSMTLNYTDGTIQHLDKTTGFVGLTNMSTITASQTWTMPDKTGTVALTSDITGSTIVSKVFGDSPYTAAVAQMVVCDATGGAMTINLPAAASSTNDEITVKKTDVSVNTVTIDGNAAELIDGALTKIISLQYDSVTVKSDGTSWWIK